LKAKGHETDRLGSVEKSACMTGSSCSAPAEASKYIVGILLAGGESRRMGGVNKALLEVGGVPIVQRVVNILSKVLQKIIIVTNSPADFAFLNLPMFSDLVPGKGSLGGLYTGLSACEGHSGFLVACDMPFLKVDVIRHMVDLAHKADVIVPRIHDKLEPLHAIYSPACLPHIPELLHRSDLKISHLFDKVDVLEVPEQDLAVFDPDFQFIINVNSPEDLQRARTVA
jgi:molybdopterin-guanine dinucleotide biosynthesis protein A